MTEKKETISGIAKLQAIQHELKAPKGQENKFGGYKYRSCEDIMEAVKPLLNKYGATLAVSDDLILIGNVDNEKSQGRFYIKATATLRDSTTGEILEQTSAFAREPVIKKGMDESQITGAASSYARKYALNGLFCIDDTKDADPMDSRPDESAKRIATMKARITALLAELPSTFDLTPFAGWENWQDEAMLLDFGQRLKKATGK